ncbi:MAG: UbiX family flavin prenyltransferase [Acidobacteria bacterium]|nr:UbiX family flavin prenyltransferase [Acidobacteriota bacterium]
MGGKTIVVGISGASGALYARRLLELLAADKRVAGVPLVVSSGGMRLLKEELHIAPKDLAQLPAALVGRAAAKKFEHLHNADIGASLASGSYPTDGMVIIPCSMGTLGAIANGLSDNLMRRAADVHLKEGRPLLVCWRDTPLNTIHLANALRVARAGGVNFPISPGYYFGARNLDELVTQFCCRVLARLGLPQERQRQWKGAGG